MASLQVDMTKSSTRHSFAWALGDAMRSDCVSMQGFSKLENRLQFLFGTEYLLVAIECDIQAACGCGYARFLTLSILSTD